MNKFSLYFYTLFALSFSCATFVYSDVGEWKSFTSSNEIRQMAMTDSSIWCATEGGVLVYNYEKNNFAQYTNTEGLTSIDVVAIEIDHRGYVWAAMADGRLNIMDPVTKSWITKTDYKGLIITDLLAYGDSIFVALNVGVSLYDAKRQEVKETYKIGESRQVYIDNRDIWVAQGDGARRASLNFPNLMAPSAWTRYTRSANGLPDDDSYALSKIDSRIVLGTAKGLAFFDGSTWSASELIDRTIWNFASMNGDLVAATGTGVYRRDQAGNWQQVGSTVVNAKNLAVASSGALWLGLTNNGLVRYNNDSFSWDSYKINGPIGNRVTSLVVDHLNNLWVSYGSSGISRFDGTTWQNFSSAEGWPISGDFRDLAVDNQNQVWAASWGSGITIIKRNENSFSLNVINSSDGRLSGVQANPNYVVILKLRLDSSGNMWILNREAANQKALAVSSPDNAWQYFSTLDGLKSTVVTALEIDLQGRKWIGTENSGISVLEDSGTPFDKSDDDLSQGLSTEDGLESLDIKAIAADYDGLVWIGTPSGLHYWFDGEIKRRYEIINDDVNCIRVDVRNNKWFGTSGGLSRLDADGFSWEHYSTSNSPLISDNITGFAMDENTGEIYIGTTNGISRLETPYSKPAANLSLVEGYPNPFVLKQSGSRFYIENLADKSSVRIYTTDGLLVRKFPKEEVQGSRIAWDGMNDRGELVASGIYVFLVTTEDGLAKAGKIAVINP
jgi:ligand-binding sensor domain-containing protein